MKIRFQTVLAFATLYLASIACGGTETLAFSVQASPSTFKAVGDTITITYTANANNYFKYDQYWGVTDNAADSPPTCTSEDIGRFSCTATHVITEQDFALGYVTSYAVVKAVVSASYGFYSTPGVALDRDATTVVYIENFTPSPTPTITPTFTATSVFTATPVFTATSTATPDPSPNAEVIFETGNTTELVECSGTEFAFTVKDPQGIKQVYVEFAVAGFDEDFSNIAATLDLTNTSGDTWSGTFDDTVSTQGQVTYWRVVVVDTNGIQTTYYEDGKFSFYARNQSCQ